MRNCLTTTQRHSFAPGVQNYQLKILKQPWQIVNRSGEGVGGWSFNWLSKQKLNVGFNQVQLVSRAIQTIPRVQFSMATTYSHTHNTKLNVFYRHDSVNKLTYWPSLSWQHVSFPFYPSPPWLSWTPFPSVSPQQNLCGKSLYLLKAVSIQWTRPQFLT